MKEKILKKDEEAVSPVIGVILMVAITVILAAVIASFVFGIGPTSEQAPVAQLVATDSSTSLGSGSNDSVVKIQHKGGETIILSEIKLIFSYTNGTQIISRDPWYSSGSMTVGDVRYLYEQGEANVTSGTYQLQLVHKPTNSFILDTKVTVS